MMKIVDVLGVMAESGLVMIISSNHDDSKNVAHHVIVH